MAGLSRVPFALLQTLTSSDLSAAFRLQGRDMLEALRYLAGDQASVLGGLLVSGPASGTGVSVAEGILVAPYAAGGSSAPQLDESGTVLGLSRSAVAVPVPVLLVDTWYTIEARPTDVDTLGTRDVQDEILGVSTPQTLIVRREAGLEFRARVGDTIEPAAAAPGWVELAYVLRRASGGTIAPGDISDQRPLLSDVAVDRLLPGSDGQILTSLAGHALWLPPAIVNDQLLTPAAITLNQNNYAPPGWSEATLVRLNPTVAGRFLLGLSSAVVQKRKVLANVGPETITLAALAGGQGAGNQIWAQGLGYALLSGATVEVVYDTVDAVWRVVTRDSFATANAWPLAQIFGDVLGLGGVSNELSYQPTPRVRTIILDQASAKPYLTANITLGKHTTGSPFAWLCGSPGILIYTFRLPHGALLQRIRVGIANGGSADVTVNCYQLEAQVGVGNSVVVDLGTETVNVASTAVITHAVPSPPATNGALHTYCVEVDLGSTGQLCSWVEAQFADPGPRNF
jgi:hypothetical protein